MTAIFSNYSTDTEIRRVSIVECVNAEITERPNGDCEVLTYQGMTDTDGVMRRVGPDAGADRFILLNSAGNQIASIIGGKLSYEAQ